MKPYYLPVLVLMACAVNAYPQNSNAQTVSLGVDKSKKPEKDRGPQFANRELSNLEKTSINVHLLPDVSGKRNLGSLNHSWRNLYLTGSIYFDGIKFISNAGERNTFLGTLAGNANPLGKENTAVGYEALLKNTSGFDNVAIGIGALTNNLDGHANSAVGARSLFNNTTGFLNCGFGFRALISNTTGSGNTASGANSLSSNTEGFSNTAFGTSALFQNITGSSNTAIGAGAMQNNTEAQLNTAAGAFSMGNNTLGFNNSAFGGFALLMNETGSYNTALGVGALSSFTNGQYNIAVGVSAGVNITNLSHSTLLGAHTIALGNLVNVTAIGFGASAFENNQVVVGNPEVTSIGGYANWSNFSDGRYKNNIQEDVPGLNFITQLRPVTYTLNIDGIEQTINAAIPDIKTQFENPSLNGLKLPTDISSAQKLKPEPTDQEIKARQDKAKVIYTGFVAQEVEKLAKEINYNFSGVDAPESENGFYSLRYGDFVVPLVKAVQELNKKNEELEQRILKLEALLSNNEESLLNNKADKKSTESVNSSSARLEQNTPNPSNGSTTIHYYLPGEVSSASIVVSDMKGIVIKNIPLTKKGSGQINIDRGILASGTYSYSLLIDGKQIDSRLMIIAR